MSEDSFQERTEKATPRRREKARKEGRVARSNELNSAVILCLGLTTVYFMGPYLTGAIKSHMTYIFSEAPNIKVTMNSAGNFLSNNILEFFIVIGPILAIIGVIAYAINALQVGIMFTTKPLEPKFDKLNLAKGMKRLISARSLVQLVRDVLKITLIATVGYYIIKAAIPIYYSLSNESIDTFASTMGTMAIMTALKIGIIIFILAILDYAYQKYDFEKSIRMSRQEIKEEMKDTEGNPQLKSRVRQMQRELTRKRMMQEIPKADVVITNPTHIAIALKYNQNEMDAPMVVAKGERLIAQKIKEIAREAGVPIVENKPLARALFKMCDIGSSVPGKLFRAVAEVLAFVYRQKTGKV